MNEDKEIKEVEMWNGQPRWKVIKTEDKDGHIFITYLDLKGLEKVDFK